MKRTILYLAPAPTLRSGIVEYAARFTSAVEEFSDWRYERANGLDSLSGASMHDLFAARRQAVQWLKDGTIERAGLVHAEIGVKQHALLQTLFWLRRLAPGLPYCITIHDPPLVVAPILYPLTCGLGSTVLRRAFRVLDAAPPVIGLLRPVLTDASGLFALSKSGVAAIAQMVPDHPRLRLLPMVNYYRTPPDISCRRGRNQVRILFFGLWNAAKGLDVLVDAMERVSVSASGQAKLVLAGGPDAGPVSRAYAQRLLERIDQSPARDAFEVAGFLSEDGVQEAFAAADALVLPYTQMVGHSTSSVLTRAMAAGLPVVASAVGTLPERIADQVTGFLTPPGDPVALAAALLTLVQEPETRLRVGATAQSFAFAAHGRQKVAEQITAEYAKMTGKTSMP